MPDPDFASKPYDASHSYDDPNNQDWRSGGGILDSVERAVSYGNYAGPGNRILTENPDYVAQQRAADPNYDETKDPKFADDPRYAPVDGIDAAAQKHDGAYDEANKGNNMFSWDGMRDFHAADETLVSDVNKEMAQNGGKYSDSATQYADGLQGFFGARDSALDAVDWAGNKASDAESGIGNFVDSAKSWSSVGDAESGIASGVQSAGSWLGDTAQQAWSGVSNFGDTIGKLGTTGEEGAALGLLDVGVAGAAHVASQAASGVVDDVSAVGSGIASGAASLFHSVEDAL